MASGSSCFFKFDVMKAIIILLLTAIAWQSNAQGIEGRIYDGKEFFYGATIQVYQKGILKGIRTTGPEGLYSFHNLDIGLYDVLLTGPGYDSILVTGVAVIPGRTTDQGGNLSRSTWEAKCIKLQFASPDIVTTPTYVSQTNRIEPLPTFAPLEVVATPTNAFQANRIEPSPASEYLESGAVLIIDWRPIVICPMPPRMEFYPREPGRYVFTRDEINQKPTHSLNDIISTVPGTYQRRGGDGVHIYGSQSVGTAYYVDGMRQ